MKGHEIGFKQIFYNSLKIEKFIQGALKLIKTKKSLSSVLP